MKKGAVKLLSLFFLAVAVALPVFWVDAAMINVGENVTFKDGVGPSPGGLFQVYNQDGVHVYDTFCLESNEYISFNTQYKVVGISDVAKRGGSGGYLADSGGDPLDPRTAFLYYNYRIDYLSTLAANAGYTFDPTSSESLGALQMAIWYIEDERNLAPNPNYLVNLANNPTYLWTNTGPVQVLNIQTTSGGYAQDQLYYAAVPEPATFLLLCCGLAGLMTLRRKNPVG